jgi:hypothetical protein
MQPKQLIEKVAELRACATAQLAFLRSSRRALACPRFSFLQSCGKPANYCDFRRRLLSVEIAKLLKSMTNSISTIPITYPWFADRFCPPIGGVAYGVRPDLIAITWFDLHWDSEHRTGNRGV